MKLRKILSPFLFITILSLLGCGSESDQGTWKIINQTQIKHSANIAGFLNETFGITVGYSGENHYTLDKGQTWPAATNSSWCLFGLDIVDPQVAWACGNAANVRFSSDGGKTWQAVTNYGRSEPDQCRYIRFLDAQTGWIANLKEVGMTTNGGKTWTAITLPKEIQEIAALDLRTVDEGYLLDTKGNLFFTHDRGKTWSSSSLKLNENEKLLTYETPLSAIRFQDASHGTAILGLADQAGKKFIAMHTKNSGKSWKRAELPISFGYGNSIFLAHDGMTLTHYEAADKMPVIVLRYQ
jgi:photosystem II stability/assembly factor-like uncharacterized protein